MSESLRNDGRIWSQARRGPPQTAPRHPEDARDYYLERMYPSYGNLAPATSPPARQKVCDEGRGVGESSRRLSRFCGRHPAPRRERRSRALRQPLRHLQGNHRRRRLPRPMRIFPASTTPWAASGWTTTDVQPPGCSSSAKPTFRPRRQPPRCLRSHAGPRDGYFVLPSRSAIISSP